jgi:hypothetical protein
VAAAGGITPERICAVKDAIRWHAPAFSERTCERLAAAFNAMPDPVLMAAICLNESDLRPTAINVVRADVYDTGLCGVRCVIEDGRCTNWPVAGMTLAELLEPVRNIEAAAKVLERKRAKSPKHYLRHYNGGTQERGYAARIGVLAAAIGGKRGVLAAAIGGKRVEVKESEPKWRRVRALVRMIRRAVNNERES